MAAIKKVQKVYHKLTTKLNLIYELRGKIIDAEEVFAPSGLLPALLKRADQLSLLCFGKGVGVEFVDEQSSMLGVVAKFRADDVEVAAILCMSDTFLELTRGRKSAKLALDELFCDSF